MANKWLAHVKKTMKSHQGMKFGQVLKMAKKTYKGGGEVAAANEPSNTALPSAAAVGGKRRTRRGRKSRRGGNMY